MNILQNKKLLLTIIFVAALLVRLCSMIILETYKFPTEESFGFGYGDTARYVALGEGYIATHFLPGPAKPTAVSPPGYVYMMALIFYLFGIYSVKSAIIIEIFQSLTAAFTCIAFYHLGKRFHETVGLLAALAMAFYPPSILFSILRISPILLVVLLLAIIIHYLFKIQERWQTRDVLVCGVLMGLNVLLEPTVILFYIASCVWLLLWSPARVAAAKCSLIMGLVCLVFVIPWTIRNYLVFDAFVPLKSSLGAHLLQGINPYSETEGVLFGSDLKQLFSEEELRKLATMDEVQANKFMEKKALEFIKADPAMFIKRTLNRIYYYWAFVNPYWVTRYENLRIITYGPIFVLAIIGIFLSGKKKWREGSLFPALMLSYPLFYYITQVTIYRYRYVPEAFLIILASFATVELVKIFGGTQSTVQSEQQAGKGLPSRPTSTLT
jgi:4-amino-4-deoxy-L-arabinose transferase-like glycosyltransferase